MTWHDEGNEGDGDVGGRDRKRPTDCNGVAAHLIDVIFGCRPGDLLDGDAGPGGAGAGASDHLWSGEDEGPVFGGGDEDPLYPLGDTDCPGSEGGEFESRGDSDPAPLRSIAAGLVPSLDDDGDPRWGRRRADERALDFLGDDACVSFLGEGEDLP